jgi:alcohol dehydrogenase
MAHQLGGFYDLPHGVCNAVLLPHVQAYNKQVAARRLGDIARAMGEDVDGLDDDAAAERCLAAIRKLSGDIGIPGGLAQLGVQTKDLPTLTANALKDACGLTNPIQASHEEIRAIFLAAM